MGIERNSRVSDDKPLATLASSDGETVNSSSKVAVTESLEFAPFADQGSTIRLAGSRAAANDDLRFIPGLGSAANYAENLIGDASPPPASMANLQVINNIVGATVDVYLDDDILVDDFGFQQATSLNTEIAAGQYNIYWVPASAADNSNPIATIPVQLAADGKYTLVANGDQMDFNFAMMSNMRSQAADDGLVEFRVVHGAASVGEVALWSHYVGIFLDNTWAHGLEFNGATSYRRVEAALHHVELAGGSQWPNNVFEVDLRNYNYQALVLAISGPGTSAETGLMIIGVTTSGDVVSFPQVVPVGDANFQYVHNVIGAAVDVYMNDDKLVDDLRFQQATSLATEIPAGQHEIHLVPAWAVDNSSPIATIPVEFAADGMYTVIANGDQTNFGVAVLANMRSESLSDNAVVFRVVHGAPGLGEVNIRSLNETVRWADSLDFNEATPYRTAGASVHHVELMDGNTQVEVFELDLSYYDNKPLVLVLSGTGTSLATGLTIMGVTPAGDVIFSQEVTPQMANVQLIHNIVGATVDVYVGDIKLVDDFGFQQATSLSTAIVAGQHSVQVVPANATDNSNPMATIPVELASFGKYTIIANGDITNFDFAMLANTRSEATSADNVDFRVVHGAASLGEVDLRLLTGTGFWANNLDFNQATGYRTAEAAVHNVELLNSNTQVDVFEFDLGHYINQTLVLALSGSGTSSAAGLTIIGVTTSGDVFTPQVVTSAQSEELPTGLTLRGNYPNPFNPRTQIQFDLPTKADVTIQVIDLLGRQVLELPAQTMEAGVNRTVELDGLSLASGSYLYRMIAEMESGVQVRIGHMVLIK